MRNGGRRRGVGEIVIGAGPERLVGHDSKFTLVRRAPDDASDGERRVERVCWFVWDVCVGGRRCQVPYLREGNVGYRESNACVCARLTLTDRSRPPLASQPRPLPIGMLSNVPLKEWVGRAGMLHQSRAMTGPEWATGRRSSWPLWDILRSHLGRLPGVSKDRTTKTGKPHYTDIYCRCPSRRRLEGAARRWARIWPIERKWDDGFSPRIWSCHVDPKDRVRKACEENKRYRTNPYTEVPVSGTGDAVVWDYERHGDFVDGTQVSLGPTF